METRPVNALRCFFSHHISNAAAAAAAQSAASAATIAKTFLVVVLVSTHMAFDCTPLTRFQLKMKERDEKGY
jgi:hypothetical protein